MADNSIETDLVAIVGDDFADLSLDVVASWESAGVGLDAVEPVLKFIETHPDIDYGLPGALVHFVERFHGRGYEEQLRESVRRSPTPQNLWMFNRVLNGERANPMRGRDIEILRAISESPDLVPATRDRAKHFLHVQTSS